VKRRQFITLLGGAAVWPLAARAQQAGKLPRVGYLSDEGAKPHLFHSQDSVLKGLRERGYADGRNIVIEYRYAAGKAESLPSLATDLVSIPVDLIVTIGSPAARAAISTTRTIPIVMARVGDPVAYGLVASVARPGGNATAVSVFTHDLAAKRVEVLKDEVPGLDRLAVLHDPSFPPGQIELQQITAAAASLKVQIHAVGVRSLAALDGALPEIMKESPQALFVGSAAWFEDNPRQIVDFALKTRLPALYIRREYVEIGGIISYGIDYREMYRNAANYIARVLRGENPGELPVLLPTKIELVINLRSAKTIDLAITSPLLIRADEVIE
jgi:putative tryptophan/tyrosine transport system substrate-binding protein